MKYNDLPGLLTYHKFKKRIDEETLNTKYHRGYKTPIGTLVIIVFLADQKIEIKRDIGCRRPLQDFSEFKYTYSKLNSIVNMFTKINK